MDIFHRRSFSEKKNRANRSHWVDLAGEFRYNVVTVLWIIRQILGGRSHGRERKLFVPLGIYFDFSRVRDWARECMEIPLHHRKVRRCGLRPDLFAVFGHSWTARHGDGAGGRPGQPEEHGLVLPRSGAGRLQMALVQLSRFCGKLSTDDVLHGHSWLAALLLCQNATG